MAVLALHRVRRRESVGITWRPAKGSGPSRATQTQWLNPAEMSNFIKHMSRKEGCTKEGIDWFMSD